MSPSILHHPHHQQRKQHDRDRNRNALHEINTPPLTETRKTTSSSTSSNHTEHDHANNMKDVQAILFPSCSTNANTSISSDAKSNATCSTAALSYAATSITSSTLGLTRNRHSSTTTSTSRYQSTPTPTTTHRRFVNVKTQHTHVNTTEPRSPKRTNTTIATAMTKMTPCSLDSPIPMKNAQLSLLDMTMDDTHDDESSVDDYSPFKKHHRQHRQKRQQQQQQDLSAASPSSTAATTQFLQEEDKINTMDRTETTADMSMATTMTSELGNSIMEQTEKNLAAISESMSGSFCKGGADIELGLNNSCTMPDCSSFNNSDSAGKSSFSDTVAQNKLFYDFNYLLGSKVTPCCEEKTFFMSCLGGGIGGYSFSSEEEEDGTDHIHKIRNRAGESWRARAYRIRRLREQRMMKDGGGGVGDGSDDNNFPTYSLSNRRQLSMERAIGKSQSMNEKLVTTNKNSNSNSNSNTKVDRSSWKTGGKPKHEMNSDPLGRMIGDCIAPIRPIAEDSVELEVVWNTETDLCYDSDPGETSFRKSLVSDKKSIVSTATTITPTSKLSKSMTRSKSTGMGLQPSSSGSRRRKTRYYSSLDYKDEDDHILGENGSFDIHVSFEDDADEDDTSFNTVDNLDDSSRYNGIAPRFNERRKNAIQEDLGIAQDVQVS